MREAMFLQTWMDFPYDSFEYFLEEGVGWNFTGRIKYITRELSGTEVLFEIEEEEQYTKWPKFWVTRTRLVKRWKREDQFKWQTVTTEDPVEVIVDCTNRED